MRSSFRVQRFCGCCTLRMGTLVIGTLRLLGSMIQLCMIPARMYLAPDYDELEHSDTNHLIPDYIIEQICAIVISILVSVLLIVGVYKKNNKFMRPWLVLECLALIAISIICLICFGSIFFQDSSYTAIYIGFTIALFLMGCVVGYFFICVWSYYMELNDRDTNVQYSQIHDSPPAYSEEVFY